MEGASPTRTATCSSPEAIFVFVSFADMRFPALLALQERLRGRFGIFSAVLHKEGLAVYPSPARGGGRRRGSAAVWKTAKVRSNF